MVLFMRAYTIWFCKRSMLLFLLVAYIVRQLSHKLNTKAHTDGQPGAASAVFAAVHTATSATAGLSFSDGHSGTF